MRNLLLVCAYARAWEEGNSCFFTILNTTLSAAQFALRELVSWCFEVFLKNDASFYEKWRVVLWETTCCFMRNDVLFYEKRRVVLREMTCCFTRNDVLFYEKRRVVLWEMTCSFMGNDVLFVQDNILVVQFYDFVLSRARALFFVRSCRSPLRGRLTTKHLLKNGIKSVPDLMSDWGLSRPSTLCSRTWHRLFIPATEVSPTLLSTFWLE